MQNREKRQNNEDDLFNNPMVREASKAMSKEQKEKYKILGECMFRDVDFDSCSVNNVPPFMAEGASRVECLLRSGLHVSSLSDDEKTLMEEVHGKEWYKSYGFTQEDLTEVVNFYNPL